MNNTYHKFLEKYCGKTFECGEYSYTMPYLKLTRAAKMKAPLEMYRSGLMILGCQQSYRRRFANHYARTLVEQGIRVIYITDALSEEQYRPEFEIDSFTRHIGLNEMDSNLVHMEELSGKFNRMPFDNGALLSIVHSKTPSKWHNLETQKDFNSKLISLLNEITNSGISEYEYGVEKPDFVVIIDEDSSSHGLDRKAFDDALYWLSAKGTGIVICGHSSCGERYKHIANRFGHYVFFRVKDPSTDLEGFDLFRRHCFQHSHIADHRDLKGLEPKDYFYTMGRFCGWSNRVTFDAGGCECCKLPPESYY